MIISNMDVRDMNIPPPTRNEDVHVSSLERIMNW